MATLTLVTPSEVQTALRLPYFGTKIPAGFPSPADDYLDRDMDLNEYLVRHPSATFFCRVSGQSMTGIGIMDDCLLVVDRAINATHGMVIVAVLNGEMTCKILDTRRQQLLSGNDEYPPIPIPEDSDFSAEGVVIHAINSFVSPS